MAPVTAAPSHHTSSIGTILSICAAAWLFPSVAISETQARGEVLAAPAAFASHPPASDVEHALDAIIKMDDGDDAVFDFAIKAPWRNSANDHRYSPYFSQALQAAWQKAEVSMVTNTCGGHYIKDEICGLNYSPITCAQDHSDAGYVYQTILTDTRAAVIEMRWSGHDNPVVTYRLIRLEEKWILDGVSCAMGGSFNWK